MGHNSRYISIYTTIFKVISFIIDALVLLKLYIIIQIETYVWLLIIHLLYVENFLILKNMSLILSIHLLV
jgi:hypothetical protein